MTTVVEDPRTLPPDLGEEVPHFACYGCEAEKLTPEKAASAKSVNDLLGMFVRTLCGIDVLTVDWRRWCEEQPLNVCPTCMKYMDLHENLCPKHSYMKGLIS